MRSLNVGECNVWCCVMHLDVGSSDVRRLRGSCPGLHTVPMHGPEPVFGYHRGLNNYLYYFGGFLTIIIV